MLCSCQMSISLLSVPSLPNILFNCWSVYKIELFHCTTKWRAIQSDRENPLDYLRTAYTPSGIRFCSTSAQKAITLPHSSLFANMLTGAPP